MADFASMIYGTAQNVAQGQGAGMSDSLKQGADLALHAEELQQKRQQVLQAKQKLEDAKMEKMIGLFETSTKMDPKSQVAFLSKGGMFRKVRDNMGLTQTIPDDGLDFMVNTPENVARAYSLINDYRSGTVKTPSDAWARVTDPTVLGTTSPYLPEINKQIAEVSKEKLNAEAQQSKYAPQNAIRTDEQAAQAVKRVNDDHMVVQATGTLNAVQKGERLLAKNPSWKTVHEVMQDYSSALNPKGGGSDFKLKQFEFEGGSQKIARVMEAVTNNPDQPAPPEVVAWLKQMGNNLTDTTHGQLAARTTQLKKEAATTYAHNPNAVKAVTDAANSYITGEALGRTKSIPFNGSVYPVSKLKDFLRDHPNDEKAAELKKALKAAGEL